MCIIAPSYPTDENPVTPFIDQLVCEFVDIGIACTVIVPSGLVGRLISRQKRLPKERIRSTANNNTIQIYHPRYFGGFPLKIFGIRVSNLSYKIFKRCVMREFIKKNIKADAIYGHFIYPSGLCAAELGSMFNIPSFLAYGESSPRNYMHLEKSFIYNRLKNLSGLIAVSSYNKREIIEQGVLPPQLEESIIVLPNGIDNNTFFVIDKSEARRRLGIDNEKFIVAFVGHYIERKGIGVLAEALNKFSDVFSFFIGKGPIEPKCKNILYKGPVPHDKLFLYLNAADVFVLPTLAEGCCNAIIEALACGLPVVSSNLPFNDDILDNNCSIRINPLSINEIFEAIQKIKNDNTLRDRMKKAALQKAKDFNLRLRAKNIIDFMENKLNSNVK